jgi:hypothetical protein
MLKLIFWVVVGVLALSFFGISLRSVVSSPVGTDNLSFLWMLIEQGWSAIVQFCTSLIPHHVP